MTDREDMDMLAAEYVLGTLDAGERRDVDARRLREPELEATISRWEERLAPMNALAGDAVPETDLLPAIEERLAAPARADGGNVVHLRNRLARWRMGAIGATAIAASLAAFIVVREVAAPPPAEQKFVAVFQEGDQPPAFLLTIDLESRQLTIRPVAAQSHPGKTYQLWIASRELGPKPRSLGLLEKPSGPTRKELREFDPRLLQEATFGISLEPEGGSPTGQPTGPALHGKLHPTAL